VSPTSTQAPVALVTGGSRRIGSAIAWELHGAGYTIALHYRHSKTEAEQLREALSAIRPESCCTFRADLNIPEHIDALVRNILRDMGGVNLLVNNASSFAASPIASTSTAEFDALLSANLRSAYCLINLLLPTLTRNRGSIVNITDMHLRRPPAGYSAYHAAKAGLESLTRSLAVELGPEIRVNAVAPGAILWPEDDAAFDAKARARLINRTPLGRLGEPEDIARTVKFLAREAPFITGQVITVDGGQSLG